MSPYIPPLKLAKRVGTWDLNQFPFPTKHATQNSKIDELESQHNGRERRMEVVFEICVLSLVKLASKGWFHLGYLGWRSGFIPHGSRNLELYRAGLFRPQPPRSLWKICQLGVRFATQTKCRVFIFDISRFQKCNFYFIPITSKF